MTTFLAWVCPRDDCDQFGPYADRPTRCINGHVTEERAVPLGRVDSFDPWSSDEEIAAAMGAYR